MSADLDDLRSSGPLPAAVAEDVGATTASSMSPKPADLVDRCDRHARARLLALVAVARLDAPVLVDTAAVTSMVEPLDDDDVRYLAATTVEALVRLGCFDTTTGGRRGSRPTGTGQQFARAGLRA